MVSSWQVNSLPLVPPRKPWKILLTIKLYLIIRTNKLRYDIILNKKAIKKNLHLKDSLCMLIQNNFKFIFKRKILNLHFKWPMYMYIYVCVCVYIYIYSYIYTHKMFLCKSAKGETYAYITVDRVFLEDSHKKSLTVVGSRIEGSLTFFKKTHRGKNIKYKDQ